MKINTSTYGASYPVFKLESPLKTAFLRGDLTIKRGLYGEKLTKENVTCEHLVPVSERGNDSIENLALASSEMNSKRGNKPLNEVLSEEQAKAWIEQFNGRVSKFFDVYEYTKLIRKTFISLGVITQ